MTDVSKNDPAEVERRVSAWWDEQGVFHAVPTADLDPYCVPMTPPKLSGPLHMGHALNQTFQDVLARWQRMKGRNVLWAPGMDPAGIEAEWAAKRQLAVEDVDAGSLEYEAFIRRVGDWTRIQATSVREQLRALGSSCDWKRERSTLDGAYASAVAAMFVRCYEKGLAYRGDAVLNFCPCCDTVLSEEECEAREEERVLYVIRCALKGGRKKDAILVATARPETLAGGSAIAVNPRDERYRDLVGRHILLPLFGHELPVIEDDAVDPEFGTGAILLTPAHAQLGLEIARRHGLPVVHAIGSDGLMCESAGPYAGQRSAECRLGIIDDLRHAGLIEEERPCRQQIDYCCYCESVLEPRHSSQWFLKMKPLARPAIDAVKQGRIRCVPERWSKVLLDWMESARDWCVSRQIRWGHPIPVFTCGACAHEWASENKPVECSACGVPGPRQEAGVLDGWFAAALWPFAILGWPEQSPDYVCYYPTQTLVTASDLLLPWVARTMTAAFECTGEAPFSNVCVHGTVRDEVGKKMSRRLGNALDPLVAVKANGADALRFTLCISATSGQDLYLADEKSKHAQVFAEQLWKAAHFMRAKDITPDELLDEPDFDKELLTPDDKHLLAKLHETISACEENLQRFRLSDYSKCIREFLLRRYCEWYLEYSREVFRNGAETTRVQVCQVMQYAFSIGLRLLHPVMPFLTEELWHVMGYKDSCFSIARAPWPRALEEEQLAADWGVTQAMVHYVDAKQDLISVGRALRADYAIKLTQPVDFIVRPARERDTQRLKADANSIAMLLKARSVNVDTDFSPPRTMPSAISQLGAIYMPLEGLLDRAAESTRMREQADKVSEQLRRITRKLENMDFLAKAPPQVVEAERARKKELLEKHDRLRKVVETLSGGKGT